MQEGTRRLEKIYEEEETDWSFWKARRIVRCTDRRRRETDSGGVSVGRKSRGMIYGAYFGKDGVDEG